MLLFGVALKDTCLIIYIRQELLQILQLVLFLTYFFTFRLFSHVLNSVYRSDLNGFKSVTYQSHIHTIYICMIGYVTLL